MGVLPRLRLLLRKPPRWRRVGLGFLGLALGLITYEAVRVLGGSNRHTVIPGRVYRCAQPTEADLRELVRDKQIRTVINLRGVSHVYDWYKAEARTLHELNVSQEDITLSANRLPPPSELRRLIEVLDHTEYPVLIHCKQGADRTGLAAVVALLLHTEATLDEALRQLWPRYGHVRFGRTAAIDRFFDYYRAWLNDQGTTHSPDRFRHWALNVYTPGAACSELTWLDPVPVTAPVNKPFAVRLRATNQSLEPWHFQPGNYAGIHLSFVVANEQLQPVHRGQAGLFRRTVQPGESIDLTLAVPALPAPGRYALVAELTDATGAAVPVRANSFVQFGDRSIMAVVFVK